MTTFDLGMVPTRPVAESLEWVMQAERLGFDGIWVADSQSIFRDAFTVLAALAVRTERMRLATGVTNPVTRHPAVLACAFASLDELSGGRAVMGIGVGASTVQTLGLPPARLAHLEATILAVRALIAGEETEWAGEKIEMPWSARRVPIVVSSSGPKSLRLGGRVADGVLFQVGSHPDLVEWAIGNVRAGAEEAGRDPDEVALYIRLGCAASEDGPRAREELKGYAAAAAVTVAFSIPEGDIPEHILGDLRALEEGYDWYHHAMPDASHNALVTDTLLDAIGVAGTPAQVTERLAELASLGIDGFVIPVTMADPLEQITVLAEEVVPAVRG